MATTANPFDDDVDLYKNSRKMMATMLMRKLSQQNPSLSGNVLNALALGIMGYAEKQAEERGAKGLGDVRKALEDAGVTTPSTTTPSTTTPSTKAESAPTSEPGPRTETPSVMVGKYPAAETGTSKPSTAKLTMPDLTTPAVPTEREPVRPMMTAGDAGNFYDRTGALGPTTPAGAGDMVAPSLDRNLALNPELMKSQAMMGVSGGEPGNNTALAAALLGQTPRPPETVSSTQPMPTPEPNDMLASVRARAASMGPALSPPPPSRPQATEMDRGSVYPSPPGGIEGRPGDDWGPPNTYRGPGAPLPPAPAPATMSPEWQRLQEYQRSQGQPSQPPPSPAMMRPGGAPGPQSALPLAAPEPSMRQEPGIRARPLQAGEGIDQAAPQRRDLTDFVKRVEGFSSTAKPDYKQWSIGYGTKGYPGQTMTREEAEAPLARELGNARQSVEKFAPNAPSGVKDALTSLTYNAGPGWQQAGLGRLISEGKYDEAKDRFLQYNKAGGAKLAGLESRRNAEISNFWNAGGGAPRPPAEAQPAPYQVAQAGGGPPPGPPAAQRPGQSVLDQLRRLADTHPDAEVRNRANSIIIQQRLQELQPPEVTWQERGGDKVPFSVDRRTGQIRQVPIQGEQAAQTAAPGQVGVPPPPPGVDPKKWRETMSTELAKRAMGETIPVEAAGRLAMMQGAQKEFASVRKELEGGWDATKRAQYLAYRAGQGWAAGDTGKALRNVDVAIESALRAMTGAAAPPAELASYRDKFMPTPFDNAESRKQKLDLLEDFMNNATKNIQQGRGMQAPDLGVRQSPAEAAKSVTGGWSIRRIN